MNKSQQGKEKGFQAGGTTCEKLWEREWHRDIETERQRLRNRNRERRTERAGHRRGRSRNLAVPRALRCPSGGHVVAGGQVCRATAV